MGKARALINRLKRREKKVRADAANFDRFNKENREEEIMAKSPRAYQLVRKIARRSDRNFGIDSINHEPKLSRRDKAGTVERFDFDPGAGTDYGMRFTMAAGMIAAIGVRPGDYVLMLQGELKGKYLKVVSVVDSTHLRLEDQASYVGPESDVWVRFQLSDVPASYK